MVMELNSCLEKIISSQSPKEVKEAWLKLKEMENFDSGSNNSIYDCDINYDKLLRLILTENRITNISEVPRLLQWFSKFPFPDTASNPISVDIAKFLLYSAAEYRLCLESLVDLVTVLKENPDKYLPPHNNHVQLCKAIVVVLSHILVPSNDDVLKRYLQGIEKIREFLRTDVKTTKEHRNISIPCLEIMCDIFLLNDVEKIESAKTDEPSSALIIILDLIDQNLWIQYMSEFVGQIIKMYSDEKIIKMLITLCKWFTRPPKCNMNYISYWTTLFIKALLNVNKQGIVREVAAGVLPSGFLVGLKLAPFHQIPVENNIVYCLMGQIGSLDLCHEMMSHIRSYLNSLDKPGIKLYPNPETTVRALLNITNGMLQRFKGHLSSLSDCECSNIIRIISAKFCDENEFDDCPNSTSFNVSQHEKEISQNLISCIPEESEDMDISYPSTSRERPDTNKAGLVNLGNTCYMNSVLQALAMTCQFCREVLLYKPTSALSKQTVLQNLQKLFALIKYSERRTYAPTEFLRTSRPPYFISGQQQDSSEFLCHLLDVMYEQEKSFFNQNTENDQRLKTKSKVEDKEMVDAEETTLMETSSSIDDGAPSTIVRWLTEVNLSEGASLQRKTQSLADFSEG